VTQAYKIPESVLVVIYTQALEVLLLQRSDVVEQAFWQSVTGSKDAPGEAWRAVAVREVQEETGIDCSNGAASGAVLSDWRLENIYGIYPRWLHRYAPGVTHNTERVFGLQLLRPLPVRLNPREHVACRWVPYLEAAELCYSPSNAEAVLLLPRFLAPVSS
jgi:dATP pyrophosphohydrolase